MSKPTIEYKFLMETNPFGRKVMTNVAEVVAFMAAKATAEGKKVPTLKYLTAGKTLCEKQIGNLDEVVQWMYDNWANDADKGEGEGKIPAPTYAYATEGVKPLAIPYIENMTEVVLAIYENFESMQYEETVAEEGTAVDINDPEANARVTGTTDKSVKVVAKKAVLKELTAAPAYAVNANGIELTAETVRIDESQLTGHTQASSNLIKVFGAETLEVKDTAFVGPTYNTIMTGQNTEVFLKSMVVEGCTFDEDCKHVNIWFAGFQDGGSLVVKDCNIKTCEQAICVSDFSGTENKLDITVENVEIETYENGEGDKYNGWILFDDRVCSGDAEFTEKAPFGPDKVTLNIKNVTAGGVKITAENFKIGVEGGAGQMMYIFCKAANKVYNYDASTAYLFPKVIVDGVEVVPPPAPNAQEPSETPQEEPNS